MPFELSKEQRDIQKAAREFAEGELLPEVALEHDLNQKFPRDIWKKACQLGFIGIHFPEEFGGQGCGVLENILVTEQFCRKDSGLGIALSFSDFAAEVVLRFGDENQKNRFLPPSQKQRLFLRAPSRSRSMEATLSTLALRPKEMDLITSLTERRVSSSTARRQIGWSSCARRTQRQSQDPAVSRSLW